MRKLTEEDFCHLEYRPRQRFGPDSMIGWHWFCTIVNLIAYILLINLSNFFVFVEGHLLWSLIFLLYTLHTGFSLLMAIPFSFKKIAYKFQRFHAVWLSISMFVITVAFYPFLYLDTMSLSPTRFPLPKEVICYIMMFGFFLLVLSFWKLVRNIKNGVVRNGGNGLYYMSDLQYHIMMIALATFGILFMAAGLIASIYAHYGSPISDKIAALIIFTCLVIAKYSFYIIYPQLLVLTYCKFKYKKFIVEPLSQKTIDRLNKSSVSYKIQKKRKG